MSRDSNLKLAFGTQEEIQSSKATLEELLNDQARTRVLQRLTIESEEPDTDGTAYRDFISSLTQLFGGGKSLLENFQTLEWDADNEFPPLLLPIFEANYPQWSIHYCGNPISSGVFSSPALTSLTVRLFHRHIASDKTVLSKVQKAIQDSKNLKKLHIIVSVGGCCQSRYNTDFSENGEVFPPLEELVLEWFCITQRCGEYWLKAMGWSQLRVLDLREGSFSAPLLPLLLPIADKLPALESIGLHLPSWTEDEVREQKDDPSSSFSLARQLFSTARAQSLLRVRLQGYYRALLPDLIDHHTTSLKDLSLHTEEEDEEDNQRIPLSLEELEEIGAKCPGLEALAIDLNISEEHTWPRSVLDALSSPKFSSLRKLKVFSLIGIAEETTQLSVEEGGSGPATTEEDVRNLSASLLTTSLEEIEVQVGEKRTVRGRPMGWIVWEWDERKVLTMNRERDGWAFSSIKTGYEV